MAVSLTEAGRLRPTKQLAMCENGYGHLGGHRTNVKGHEVRSDGACL